MARSPAGTSSKTTAPNYESTGQLEFVVMTDPNAAGDFFVGNRYASMPHHREALAGHAVATRVYTDAEGAWISACAPIYNRAGQIVAVLQIDRTVDFFYTQARHQSEPILLGALAAILFATFAAVPFARSLVRPLATLTLATRKFADGNLDHRVDLQRADELGELGQGFNTMAAEIQATHTQMAAQQTALEHSLDRAHAASRAKDEFLATMSHEIRTPMNAIVGFNNLLRDTPLAPEQRDFVDTVASSAEGLLIILNDVLDFAKIESETLTFDCRVLSLDESVREAAKILRPQAERKQLSLTVSVDPRLPLRLLGDPGRLRQILLSLLSNAIKFTPSGGVLIQADLCRIIDDRAEISLAVTDNGIGIEPADLAKLFQPFVQIDSSFSRPYGGIGLGLAITKRLVTVMGGAITAESEPGRGSTFRITASLALAPDPVIIPPAAATAPAPAPVASSPSAVPSFAPPVDDRPAPPPLRILLVEDNAVNQKLALRVLQMSGYPAEVAANGQIGVEKHCANPFDLILMELQMPVMDGFEATCAIRAFEAESGLARVPIVAVTANAMAGDDQRCYEVGIDGYIPKPFNRDKLLDAIRTLSAPPS